MELLQSFDTSEFTPNVKLLSLCGDEPLIKTELKHYLSGDENLVQCHSSITSIIKHRYVEPTSDGKELSKLFSVNHLDEVLPPKLKNDLCDKLYSIIEDFDLILIADFGHGLMSENIREIVQRGPLLLLLIAKQTAIILDSIL